MQVPVFCLQVGKLLRAVSILLLKCISVLEPPPWMLNRPEIDKNSVYADRLMRKNNTSFRDLKRKLLQNIIPPSSNQPDESFRIPNFDAQQHQRQTVESDTYFSTAGRRRKTVRLSENSSTAIPEEKLNNLIKGYLELSKYKSSHNHGPSLGVSILLLLEACVSIGLFFVIVAIGFDGALADVVNVEYLKLSTVNLVSVPIGLWIFVLSTFRNPETLMTKIMTSFYFLIECAAFGASTFNLYRFVSNVGENDQWYLLLTSRDRPESLLNELERDKTPRDSKNEIDPGQQACFEFVSQLHQGKCARPHAILVLFILSMIVLTLLSGALLWLILSFNIHVYSTGLKNRVKKKQSTDRLLGESIDSKSENDGVYSSDDESDEKPAQEASLSARSRANTIGDTVVEEGVGEACGEVIGGTLALLTCCGEKPQIEGGGGVLLGEDKRSITDRNSTGHIQAETVGLETRRSNEIQTKSNRKSRADEIAQEYQPPYSPPTGFSSTTYPLDLPRDAAFVSLPADSKIINRAHSESNDETSIFMECYDDTTKNPLPSTTDEEEDDEEEDEDLMYSDRAQKYFDLGFVETENYGVELNYDSP